MITVAMGGLVDVASQQDPKRETDRHLQNKKVYRYGRPWLPTGMAAGARSTVEAMGIITDRLLKALADDR